MPPLPGASVSNIPPHVLRTVSRSLRVGGACQAPSLYLSVFPKGKGLSTRAVLLLNSGRSRHHSAPSNLQPRPVSCPKCPCGMSPAGARPRCSLRSVVLPRVLTPEAPQLSSSWLTLPPVKASRTVISRCSAWRELGGPRAGRRALTSSQPPAPSCSRQPFPTSSRMQDVSQRKCMKWRWKPGLVKCSCVSGR